MTELKQYIIDEAEHLKTVSLEELLKEVYTYSVCDNYDGYWTTEGAFLRDKSREILETRLIEAGLLEDYIKYD